MDPISSLAMARAHQAHMTGLAPLPGGPWPPPQPPPYFLPQQPMQGVPFPVAHPPIQGLMGPPAPQHYLGPAPPPQPPPSSLPAPRPLPPAVPPPPSIPEPSDPPPLPPVMDPAVEEALRKGFEEAERYVRAIIHRHFCFLVPEIANTRHRFSLLLSLAHSPTRENYIYHTLESSHRTSNMHTSSLNTAAGPAPAPGPARKPPPTVLKPQGRMNFMVKPSPFAAPTAQPTTTTAVPAASVPVVLLDESAKKNFAEEQKAATVTVANHALAAQETAAAAPPQEPRPATEGHGTPAAAKGDFLPKGLTEEDFVRHFFLNGT